ncbi:MAG: hypothetical protein ACRD68_04065, partial [Pyrinomonadaceae bacterium]
SRPARRRWRRHVNRRNVMWAGVAATAAVLALAFILFLFVRSGQVDEVVRDQIVDTLKKYGIRAEIEGVETQIGPRTAILTNVVLYDEKTGAKLAEIDRLVAVVRVEDLWALNLRRNVDLERLEIDGLEAWVTFDGQGRSNFSNLRLPEPDPNRRILFSYSTAEIKISNSVIHYDDDRYDISGEARNLRATVRPQDPNAPEESRMNVVELSATDSTFGYEGRDVRPVNVELRALVNQVRAEIQELVIKSPVAEARLSGTMDDWRELRYQLNINSTVDLTQLSDVLRAETTLRGAGQFAGTVSGQGAKYRIDGQIQSDALAADGVRLKALNVNAVATGEGAAYEAQGRAVAELLTAGDFQLNAVQLAGGVMGTGTDFRWVGELRAAAARSGETSIAGLILSDAVAEFRRGTISGSAKRATARGVAAGGTSVSGVEASGLQFTRAENGATKGSAASITAGRVLAEGATAGGVTATNVEADIAADGTTRVTVDKARVDGLTAAGAQTGSINIAGVRLAIREGRVEGTSQDINVGIVAFNTGTGQAGAGRAENVRLARPVFVLEPSGRYRASADLSLGGGVLGTMRLGAARAGVVATNGAVQLNDFTADVFGGRAAGDATIAIARGGASRVAAEFTGIDVGGLLAAFSGRVVPLAGAATGSVDLRFPGTNFEAASGTLNAQFSGETGTEEGGRTPLTGDVVLRADRGLFQIERANVRTAASELKASGQFSFGDDSNLRVNLNSSDASELQRIAVASGLLPELEEALDRYKIGLAGNLTFDGTLAGPLDDPLVNGQVSLGSLVVRGRDLGALSANIASTPADVRVTDGRLAERDGGGATFTATIPRAGENNVTLEATLDRADAGNLVAAFLGDTGRG